MALVSNIPLNIFARCDSTCIGTQLHASSTTLGNFSNHKLGFITNNTVRATLDTSGNLGIGTDSPGARLDVRGTAIFNEGGGDYDVRMEGDSDANLFYLDASTDRIGIGTATPAALFHAEGVACVTGNTVIGGDLTVAGDDITLGTNTSGYILVADGTNYNPVAVSGDVAIDSGGDTTIQAGSVENSMLAGSIANDKLANRSVSYGGISLSLGDTDATPAFDLADATNYPTSSLVGTITNAQLAGSIANDKLSNSSVNFGGITVALGASDTTPAFDLSDATDYPTSSLVGTITNAQLAGSIANGKLANSTVSYGGVSLALGGSDGTPAFDLSDATAYPGDTSLVCVGTIAGGTWQGTAIDTAYIGATLCDKTLCAPVLNGTISGSSFLDEDDFSSDSATSVASQQSIKAYVDAVASGLDLKGSSHVATTANLSANYNNGTAGVGATLTNSGTQEALSIDGDTLVASERVLVKDQTEACHNGIYTVTTVGNGSTNWVMTRATDYDTSTEITSGSFTFVETGTTNGDHAFVMTTDGTITVGTTAINWTQFSGAGQITAGAGLTKSGSTISVGAGSNITVNADDVALSTTITGLAALTSTDITGTLQTAAQANITSVGTLTSLCSSGDVTVGGDLTIAGDDLTMGTNTSGYLLIADGTNFNPTAVSGDVTIDNSGATTIGATTVTNAMLAGSIANAKLSNSSVSYGGVSLSLGGTDATPAFDLSDATNYPTSSLVGTITNAQLAGSISNDKLANCTVSYGGVTIALGSSDATPAFDLADATNYPTSSLVGTITNAQLAGSIANDKLANCTVNYGGVTLALGASDTTPAFDLADATNYPTSSLVGTITNAQLAGSIANDKLANSTITLSDGSNTTAIALGGTMTFSGTADEVEVSESSGTLTIGLPSTVSGLTNVSATNLTGTLATAAQGNVTSVGTLTSLVVSGDITVDTTTLKVNSTTNRVGIGTATPSHLLDVEGVVNVVTCVITPVYCVNGQYALPAADGTIGQVLCTDGSGGLSFATNIPASPGGSDTYVQFNDGGATFGGSANFTWDDTTVKASNFCTAGTATLATVDINAGAIDGTTIGASSASTIAGTTLTATGNVSFDGGTFVFNESGADKDFRIEGDSEANLFIVDASTDRIGVGTATPSHLVDIEGVAHAATCFVSADVCATTKVVAAALCVGGAFVLPTSDGSAGQIICTDGSGALAFATDSTNNPGGNNTNVQFNNSGSFAGSDNLTWDGSTLTVATTVSATNLGGTLSTAAQANVTSLGTLSTLAVSGDVTIDTTTLKVDSSNNRVGIGTATPSHLLDVDGVANVATCIITPVYCVASEYVLPSADGTAGQVMCTDGSGGLAFATNIPASPGGSDTYVQFNDSSSFGGSANLTWDDTTLKASNICTAGTATLVTVAATTITGTIGTAAQTNITSVGNLSSLCVTGDTVVGGDLTIAGDDLTMGTNTSGYILVADGTNYNPVAVSGDVTISSAGAITIVEDAVENSMLANCTVSYGGIQLVLGGSDATPAFDLTDATNYPTSSLVGTITNAQLAGSIVNAKLVNDSVSFGGVSVDLGASDATPAFDLSDATAYTGDSSLVTVGTISSGTWQGSDIASAYIASTLNGKTLASATLTSPVLNGTLSGTAFLDEDNMTSDSAGAVASQQSIKAYVDSVASGLDMKCSSHVATTACLTSTYNNGSSGVGATLTNAGTQAALSIDGQTLASSERVLIKDQTAACHNGIYSVTTVGDGSTNWVITRTTDFDSSTEITSGAFTFVETGSTNGDHGFVMTSDGTITIGTTAINWTQFSGAGQITAGAGMTKTGNTLNVIAGDNITVNADDVALSTTITGVTSLSSTCLTGTLQTAAQPNITSVGTLTGLTIFSGGSFCSPIVCSTILCSTGNTVVGGDLTIAGDDITMATNTSGYILVADGTNYNPVAVSGDVTISNAGAVTIAAGAVENSMLANCTITVSDGSNTTAIALGGTATFSGTSNEVEVSESSGTLTIGLPSTVSGLTTVSATNLTGTLSTAAQTNITSVGTLSSLDVSGDLTVGTVTADGDTAAGDAATMGYTATEGLILTGQGSTSDVTIKNDADGTVMYVPTGGTTTCFPGIMCVSNCVCVHTKVVAGTVVQAPDLCATTKVVGAALCVGGAYALPASDGSAGEILCTDGSGAIAFAEAASSGHTIAEDGSTLAARTCLNFCGTAVTVTDCSHTNSTDVMVRATGACMPIRVTDGTQCYSCLEASVIGDCLQCDSSPTLGGSLDVNGNSIVSASNGNIPITPNGSGIVIVDGICHPTADGSTGQVLCTNGSAALQWATIADTTPGGSDTYVQFNNGGAFGGAAGLTWDDTTFKASNICTAGTATIGGDLTIAGDDLTMGTNTSGYILVADGTNYNPVAVSGDVTISNAGAVTIAAHAVENGMLAGSIANSKLSNSTITISDGSNTTAISLGGTATFSGTSNEVEVAESSGTVTIGLPSTVSGLTTVSATTLTGTLSTAAQTNITSVGTLGSLAVSGDLTVDTTTLKVDSSNNRVGIGTATPDASLAITGADTGSTYALKIDASDNDPLLSIRNDGYTNLTRQSADGSVIQYWNNSAGMVMTLLDTGSLGIGTNAPSTPLSVFSSGNAYISSCSTGSSAGIKINSDTGSFTWYAANGTNALMLYDNVAAAERIRIDSSGDVMIGSTNKGPSDGSTVTTLRVANFGSQGDAGSLELVGQQASGSSSQTVGNIDFLGYATDGGTLTSRAAIRSVTQSEYRNSTLQFWTNRADEAYTQRMVIDSNGNVGIATTAPAEKLHVLGNAAICDVKICYRAGRQFGIQMVENNCCTNCSATFMMGMRNCFVNGVEYQTACMCMHAFHTCYSDFGFGIVRNNGMTHVFGLANNPVCADCAKACFRGVVCATVDVNAPTKSFIINHPCCNPDTPNKYNSMRLRHVAIEAPEHGVFYRGEAQLCDGKAQVILPEYFESLTHDDDRTVHLTNVGNWAPLSLMTVCCGHVSCGMFWVCTTSEGSQDAKFHWRVDARRFDGHIRDNAFRDGVVDDDGRLITEFWKDEFTLNEDPDEPDQLDVLEIDEMKELLDIQNIDYEPSDTKEELLEKLRETLTNRIKNKTAK